MEREDGRTKTEQKTGGSRRVDKKDQDDKPKSKKKAKRKPKL